MEKQALEYLVDLNPTEVIEVNGRNYSTNEIHLVPTPRPQALTVRNLSGLVDYLTDNFDDQPAVLIHIESPTEVSVVSTFNADMQRNVLIRAEALLPRIPFENYQGAEEFNIQLQSCFVPNEDRAKILALVGNIREEGTVSYVDDGVTQQVAAKSGIATVENVSVPNPVHLKPFRTFVDIAQPECQFVFRLRKGPQAGLFEADGGAWKLQAIASIKEYLAKALAEQIEANKVFIIA